jgi:signal transduction histidine kinase
MKLEKNIFHTKVARRVFTLFIICAIVPIAALALVSFNHVRTQLENQSRERLHQECKSLAMSICGQMVLLSSEMKMAAANIAASSGNLSRTLPLNLVENIKGRFASLGVISEKGHYTPLVGRAVRPIKLTTLQENHINSGKALLVSRLSDDFPPCLFMFVSLDPSDQRRGILMGEIDNTSFWSVADRKPPMTEVCVADRSCNIFYRSDSGCKFFSDQIFRKTNTAHAGQFEWDHDGKTYIAGFFSIFLKPSFSAPEWLIVLSESRDHILAPMANFSRAFPIIIVMSLGMVFLFSISQIRKNMIPIETLKDATKKIADGAFGHTVEIKSGDEFESLGSSFNDMSNKLQEGQALLVQAAKLSTVGQMSAGIVHEIKQPLTAIHGHLQLALMENPSGKNAERLTKIMDAVERLNGLLLKFKSFSYMSEEQRENLLITNVVDQVYELLGHQFVMKSICCTIEHEKHLPYILADNDRLQQVITNLLINAMDALEENQAGDRRIHIQTYSSVDTVYVAIEDNGCGIPQEIIQRIFEPFFTTKSADKGTGLGMAIIKSILEKHEATIDIQSEVGKGTRFIIGFPVVS